MGTDKPSRRSHWDIAVLAFLREAPMHPYEMQRLLRERNKDELLALKRGSLYHAIGQLVRDGLIESAGTERQGRRPERTIYRLTPTGRRTFVECVRAMVGVPRLERSEFFAGLSFLIYLPPEAAVDELTRRAARLEDEIGRLVARGKALQDRVERINLIEEEYLAAMRRAELRWVRSVLADLREGRLTWELERHLREAAKRAASKEKAP